MVKCSETHRFEGEALHKLTQAKKFQLSKLQIAAPLFKISEYAPGYGDVTRIKKEQTFNNSVRLRQ